MCAHHTNGPLTFVSNSFDQPANLPSHGPRRVAQSTTHCHTRHRISCSVPDILASGLRIGTRFVEPITYSIVGIGRHISDCVSCLR